MEAVDGTRSLPGEAVERDKVASRRRRDEFESRWFSVTTVRVRRVYESRRDEDGVRVLVDRLWPRGMTKVRAELDEWCKEAAPSTELRRWYAHDPERFAEFRRRYKGELRAGEQAEAIRHLRHLVATKRRITLLTAAKDPTISEATVLADVISSTTSR